jgi:hypothetical protein
LLFLHLFHPRIFLPAEADEKAREIKEVVVEGGLLRKRLDRKRAGDVLATVELGEEAHCLRQQEAVRWVPPLSDVNPSDWVI